MSTETYSQRGHSPPIRQPLNKERYKPTKMETDSTQGYSCFLTCKKDTREEKMLLYSHKGSLQSLMVLEDGLRTTSIQLTTQGDYAKSKA